MGAKKIMSIIIASLLVIVVAVLGVYVVFFKDKKTNLVYSLNENDEEDGDKSKLSSSEKDETKYKITTPIGG